MSASTDRTSRPPPSSVPEPKKPPGPVSSGDTQTARLAASLRRLATAKTISSDIISSHSTKHVPTAADMAHEADTHTHIHTHTHTHTPRHAPPLHQRTPARSAVPCRAPQHLRPPTTQRRGSARPAADGGGGGGPLRPCGPGHWCARICASLPSHVLLSTLGRRPRIKLRVQYVGIRWVGTHVRTYVHPCRDLLPPRSVP